MRGAAPSSVTYRCICAERTGSGVPGALRPGIVIVTPFEGGLLESDGEKVATYGAGSPILGNGRPDSSVHAKSNNHSAHAKQRLA